MERDTFTFQDAVRQVRPVAFAALCKPVGAACNLNCTYCYYLDKASLYEGVMPRMDDALLERFVREYIEANAVPEVTFCWHGGEPLLAGLSFFRRAVAFQRKYAGGKLIRNTVQTNGTLVDEAWSQFFADEEFLVGLSLDGPEDLHDAFRRTREGAPTFGRVMRTVERFLRDGVAFNTLSVIHRCSEGRGAEIYAFLKAVGSCYMQFLPAVEYVGAGAGKKSHIVPPGTEGAHLADWSVSPGGYGQFLCDVFDEWITADVGRCFVQFFDAVLAQWCGLQPGVCALCETCGEALAVEHNGDVYACDHFVYPSYKLGNIMHAGLADLFGSEARLRFARGKRNGLPVSCFRCKWHFVCRGGCPQQRLPDAAGGAHVLCRGLQLFFDHSAPYMEQMRNLLNHRLAPAYVMPWARGRLGRREG